MYGEKGQFVNVQCIKTKFVFDDLRRSSEIILTDKI